MKERPILFSAPMIRAILAGAKTVTRRAIKPAPVHVTPFIGRDDLPTHEFGLHLHTDRVIEKHVRCPYGKPGDRLWVREAIRKMEPPDMPPHEDGTPVVYSQYVADEAWTVATAWPWKRDRLPGMFMPRGLSRITLDVVSVRVERLHEVTEDEAKAEGVDVSRALDETHRHGFESLWREINGAASWDANPWVWRIEFRRVEVER